MRDQRLLFVCTGNLCRSPMAAEITRSLAETSGLELEVRSAGTHAIDGDPAPDAVVAVCREIGVDLTAHRATRLDGDGIRWADRIYVMEPDHAVAVRTLVPDLEEARVVHFAALVGKDRVADPYGSWFRFRYRWARDEIRSGIVRLLAR